MGNVPFSTYLTQVRSTPSYLGKVLGTLAYGDLVLEGVPPASIIAYGESLGSGVAVRIGIERKVAGVILDAPYTSIVDVAARAYPFVPVRAFLIDRYETSKYIANLRVPLLILHGEHDPVVPVAMGRELARLANEPKRLVVFPNGGHSNLYIDGNNAIEPVRQWIAELKTRAGASQTDAGRRQE